MKIALLDDKEYGIQQIRNAFPSQLAAELCWFPTVDNFQKTDMIFDIVFLDYYLDIDGVTGDQIINIVRNHARVIIGFSSIDSGNRRLLEAGADYAINKVAGDRNEPLFDLLLELQDEKT